MFNLFEDCKDEYIIKQWRLSGSKCTLDQCYKLSTPQKVFAKYDIDKAESLKDTWFENYHTNLWRSYFHPQNN